MSLADASILHLRRPLDVLLSKLAQDMEQAPVGAALELDEEVVSYLVYTGAQFSTMIFSALEVSLPLQTELWVGFQQPILRRYREDAREAASDNIYKHVSYFYKVFLQRLIEYCPDCPEFKHVRRVFDISKPENSARFDKCPKAIYLRAAYNAVCRVGDLSRYRGRLANATLYYKLATRLLPGSGAALNQLGSLSYKAGDLRDALFYFTKSLSVREPASDGNLRVVLRKIVRGFSKDNSAIMRIFICFARVYLDSNKGGNSDSCVGLTDAVLTETCCDADVLAKLAMITICFAHLTQSGIVLEHAVDTIHALLDLYDTSGAAYVLPALHLYMDWLAKNPTVATEVDSRRLARCAKKLRSLTTVPQCGAAESLHAAGIEFLNGGLSQDDSQRRGRILGILASVERILNNNNYYTEQTKLTMGENHKANNMSNKGKKEIIKKKNETELEQGNDEEIVFLGRR